MAGAMPVVNMSCFLSNNIDLRGFKMKLPIIDVNAYQQSKTTIITTTHDPRTKLLSMYNDIMTHSDLYSRAPFYLSFWLHQLLPIDETASHINRGISKHNEFIQTYIPRLRNYMLHKPNKLLSSLDDTQEEREMCELPKSRKPVAIHSRMEGGSEGMTIEIVIPRCCESLQGDLAWIHHLAAFIKQTKQQQQYHHHHHPLTISIYYKCPWCLPKSYLHDWLPLLIHSTTDSINITKNNSKNDNISTNDGEVHLSSLKLSSIDRAHAVELIRSLGCNGIEVLEDFTALQSNSSLVVIREVPAFDLHVNGKEATVSLLL